MSNISQQTRTFFKRTINAIKNLNMKLIDWETEMKIHRKNWITTKSDYLFECLWSSYKRILISWVSNILLHHCFFLDLDEKTTKHAEYWCVDHLWLLKIPTNWNLANWNRSVNKTAIAKNLGIFYNFWNNHKNWT